MAKVPKFSSLEEQALFWDTNDSVNYFDDTEPVKITFKRKAISKASYKFLIKTIKKEKGVKPYNTIVKVFQNKKILLDKKYLKFELSIVP